MKQKNKGCVTIPTDVDVIINVEVHAYVKNRKYCVVNNTYEPQSTAVYTGDGSSFTLDLDANEIRWYQIG